MSEKSPAGNGGEIEPEYEEDHPTAGKEGARVGAVGVPAPIRPGNVGSLDDVPADVDGVPVPEEGAAGRAGDGVGTGGGA